LYIFKNHVTDVMDEFNDFGGYIHGI